MKTVKEKDVTQRSRNPRNQISSLTYLSAQLTDKPSSNLILVASNLSILDVSSQDALSRRPPLGCCGSRRRQAPAEGRSSHRCAQRKDRPGEGKQIKPYQYFWF